MKTKAEYERERKAFLKSLGYKRLERPVPGDKYDEEYERLKKLYPTPRKRDAE